MIDINRSLKKDDRLVVLDYHSPEYPEWWDVRHEVSEKFGLVPRLYVNILPLGAGQNGR